MPVQRSLARFAADAAGPFLRRALFLLTASALAGAATCAAAETASGNRCDDVVAGGPIDYRGTRLLETADIATPEIRRINVLISTRCYREARDAIARYRQAAPADYQIEFVDTRMLWILVGTEEAEQAVALQLTRHPDFDSMKVLQASILMERRRYAAASKVLDDVARRMPNDLWLLVDRMKIELLDGPRADIAERLKPMLDSPQFPPSVREVMGMELMRLPDLPNKARASAYRTLLTFESATPFAQKMRIIAHASVMKNSDPDVAIELLVPAIADRRAISAAAELKMYLGIAYVQKAAAIDSKSTPRNAALIAKGADQFGLCVLRKSLVGAPGSERLLALVDDWAKGGKPAERC